MPPSYDEFAFFAENAAEFGLPSRAPPVVRRESVAVAPDRRVSALVWGTGPPELVLLHGGAQNAHTWDTVALALDRPLVAIDLPGHGHSDPAGADGAEVAGLAADVAEVVRQLAGGASAVVGMSLGGLTALSMAAQCPDLVRHLVLVDITPGVTGTKAAAIVDFVSGPASFASFEEILQRTVAFNPTRTLASLRRGVLHNAVERPDGSWVWRHAGFQLRGGGVGSDLAELWEAVSVLGRRETPVLLVRGGTDGSVVDDHDEAELRRRAPQANVVTIAGAGHSVQGDRPVELAAVLGDAVREGALTTTPPARTGRSTAASLTSSPVLDPEVRRRWLSPRAIGLHVLLVVTVPTFAALCDWQLHRALSGNELSWAYVFEWPFFACYATVVWWRFVHEPPAGTMRPRRQAARVDPAADEAAGAELAAYNRYLAELDATNRPKRW